MIEDTADGPQEIRAVKRQPVFWVGYSLKPAPRQTITGSGIGILLSTARSCLLIGVSSWS